LVWLGAPGVVDQVESNDRFKAAKRQALDHIAQSAIRLTFADPSTEVVANAAMSEARADLNSMYSIGTEIAKAAGRRSPFGGAYQEEYEKVLRGSVIAGILERRAAANTKR
jgi:hypothetical protein